MLKKLTIFIAMASILFLFGTVVAKDVDYSFMPKSGATLLIDVLKKCKTCDLKTILGSKMTADKWKEYFQSKGALAGLTPKEVDTLVSYLIINMPGTSKAMDISKIKNSDLPEDGEMILLEQCSLCHPIGPILTQKRDLKGWQSVYRTNPHPEVGLNKKQQDELFGYLAINMPLNKKQIPAELQGELPGY